MRGWVGCLPFHKWRAKNTSKLMLLLCKTLPLLSPNELCFRKLRAKKRQLAAAAAIKHIFAPRKKKSTTLSPFSSLLQNAERLPTVLILLNILCYTHTPCVMKATSKHRHERHERCKIVLCNPGSFIILKQNLRKQLFFVQV